MVLLVITVHSNIKQVYHWQRSVKIPKVLQLYRYLRCEIFTLHIHSLYLPNLSFSLSSLTDVFLY